MKKKTKGENSDIPSSVWQAYAEQMVIESR